MYNNNPWEETTIKTKLIEWTIFLIIVILFAAPLVYVVIHLQSETICLEKGIVKDLDGFNGRSGEYIYELEGGRRIKIYDSSPASNGEEICIRKTTKFIWK